MGSDNHKYDDIINLPHHVSKTHPPMDIMDRAAQFSPFAALTGYKEAAEETRRLTSQRFSLTKHRKSCLILNFISWKPVFYKKQLSQLLILFQTKRRTAVFITRFPEPCEKLIITDVFFV